MEPPQSIPLCCIKDDDPSNFSAARKVLSIIEEDICQLAIVLGAAQKVSTDGPSDWCHIPLSLFPSPFPAHLYK